LAKHPAPPPSRGILTDKPFFNFKSKNTQPTLGEKLKQTLTDLEQANIKGVEAQAAADMEVIRRARADLEDWLEHLRFDLVAQIERGQVPLKKVKDYNRQTWLRSANKGHAANHDLWTNFRNFWAKEGLEPVLKEAHDGVGIESWINLTVEVLPPRPRIGESQYD
jgi:hypothetical protein